MIEIDKTQCTGCGSCALVCPNNSIEMKTDNEGFKYPVINQRSCVNCGLCDKHCHVYQNKTIKNIDFHSKIFVGYSKDFDERINSSSGGIFSLFARYVINLGGVVYGAAFDDEFNVVHLRCDNEKSLAKLRGSKYVQSDLKETFVQAKYDLEHSIPVLFTGTPCQIGALKKYLGKNYDNLYTQSLICHGVPSPRVWKKYLEYIEKSNGKIRSISFRDKTNGWSDYALKFTFADADDLIISHNKDIFINLFLKNACLRPSCHNCYYKNYDAHTLSDITLEDWWGMDREVLPNVGDNGASIIIINSQKGKILFDKISHKLVFEAASYASTIGKNPSYFQHSVPSEQRSKIFMHLEDMNINKISKKYASPPLGYKIKRKIFSLIYAISAYIGVLKIYKAIKKFINKSNS